MTNLFMVFHLNLAYSSIEEERHGEVIKACYHPLLDMIERHPVVAGIELSGWTLECIQAVDPGWISRLKSLIKKGKCELVGSGYVQMIGPLVPYEVNLWNQQLGLAVYQQHLGIRPAMALVNEMAFASGLIDLYREAGYQGIIMDRDNVCLALGLESEEMPPHEADNGDGETLPVLWSDSIFFQKFQRYAHGDIPLQDYLDYFNRRRANSDLLAIYSNDVEIFDFRPGRYKEEAELQDTGEWLQIDKLITAINKEADTAWLLPTAAMQFQSTLSQRPAAVLTSAAQPVPVKKQAKYNLSRWAISGRDDLWLNTLCQRFYLKLKAVGDKVERRQQRTLCRLWASDMRTHITEKRWQGLKQEVIDFAASLAVSDAFDHGVQLTAKELLKDDTRQALGVKVDYDPEGIYLSLVSDSVKLVLNLRRGLAIQSLAFKSHGLVPVLGTLPHGFFNSIELGADFYSGGVVLELIREHRRITDLERVEPCFYRQGEWLYIEAQIETAYGKIIKTLGLSLTEERIKYAVDFPAWERPFGTVRVGHFTLMPEAFEAAMGFAVTNGGLKSERFSVDGAFNHQRPASSLVSCSTGVGATDGRLVIGDRQRGVAVEWRPDHSAVFAMLYHHPCPPGSLTRLVLSLSEVDETFREGGTLPGFECHVTPTDGYQDGI